MAEIKQLLKVFTIESYKKLEGKLLTVVESFGLPQRQEEAAKSIIRQSLWDTWFNRPFVPPELVDAIGQVKVTQIQSDKLNDNGEQWL